MKLLVKKLTDTAIAPKKDRPEDEGWDIFADENTVLKAGRVTKVSTGIACAVEGERVWREQLGRHINIKYWIQIEGRSGMASKGIQPFGGVLDLNYRGEISVILANMSEEGYSIAKGDKIAQLVIRRHYDPILEEVTELDETDRGDKGFGSSGSR